MKPADAKAPKFDSKWWKANKAKAADPDMKFEKALQAYEKAKAAFLQGAKVSDRSTSTDSIAATLKDVKLAAAKAAANPKLGTLQKETKEALTNYGKLVDAAIAECKRVSGAPLLGMDVPVLVKSAPQFAQYCTKNHQAESYNFLSLMAKNPKKERRCYDDFIKQGSKFEINIPNSTRAGFDKIAAEVKAAKSPDTPATWAAAPWDKAVDDITKLVRSDVMPRFRAWATGMMLAPKLP